MADNNDNNNQSNRDDDQAEIEAVLVEIDFPATRDELVSAARDADAADSVIVLLQSLPSDEYASPEDVNNALDRSRGGQS